MEAAPGNGGGQSFKQVQDLKDGNLCLESEKGVDHIKRKQLRHCKVLRQPGTEKAGISQLWTAGATKKIRTGWGFEEETRNFQPYKSLMQMRKKQGQRKEQLLCPPRIPKFSGWVFPHTILHPRISLAFTKFHRGSGSSSQTHRQKLAQCQSLFANRETPGHCFTSGCEHQESMCQNPLFLNSLILLDKIIYKFLCNNSK